MEAGGPRPGDQQRRPLLAGGEHLSAALDRPNTWGPKRHPRTVEEAIAILAPQVEEMQERVASTPAQMRGARVVFEAKILPNYLAYSNFPAELFAEADLVPVGTRAAYGEYTTPKSPPEERETKSYLLAGDERSFSRLGGLLRGEVGAGRAARRAYESLRQFDTVHLPSAEETLRGVGELGGETITWEAVFHPAVDGAGELTALERDAVWEKWSALVAGLGGELASAYRRQIKGLTFVPVRLPTDAGRLAAQFNPLRTLRPMPSIRPMPVSPLRVLDRQAPGPPPGTRPQSDLRVAVFDGGVDAGASQLAPFVTVTDLSTEPPDPGDVEHGTLVTASTLFGANHTDGELQTPEVGVDHFRVLPIPAEEGWDLDLYWLLDRIVEQLRGGAYRMVNLSLGPSQCLEEDIEPHAWTAVLDELAEDQDILFLTAVGNNGGEEATIGAHRIQAPSDMVNGIGVGACDSRSPDPWARAPYSAWGPGRPGARMQPTGVAFGGTEAAPFRGITSAGRVAETLGTSFASPVAMHGLSALAAQLGGVGADPSVLRAFAAHCAERPEEDRHEEVGFGRLPERYDGALECAPNEATILYRDEIARGQMLSLPFPLPAEILANRTVSLAWTIAIAAPTDPKDPVEYTQAGIEASFRPHAQTFTFTHPDTKASETVNVAARPAWASELMGRGYVPGPLPKTAQHGRYRHETLRRKEDGKWETVLHASARKRASSLLAPQATIVYLAREGGRRLDTAAPLRFAMLLTIRAGNSDLALYDAVRAGYQVLQPLRAQLPLRLET